VVVDCLQMRRQRDKTSKSFKGRQQCKLVTGIEGRGAKTASSGTKDGFCVVDWVNGVGRERAGGVRSKKSRVLHPASGRNARERQSYAHAPPAVHDAPARDLSAHFAPGGPFSDSSRSWDVSKYVFAFRAAYSF
jgi:hypothetical protein